MNEHKKYVKNKQKRIGKNKFDNFECQYFGQNKTFFIFSKFNSVNYPWFPASFLIQKVTYTTTVLKQSIGYIPSSQNFGYNTSVKKQEYKNNLRVNSVKQLI